jgi:hypothetical protein
MLSQGTYEPLRRVPTPPGHGQIELRPRSPARIPTSSTRAPLPTTRIARPPRAGTLPIRYLKCDPSLVATPDCGRTEPDRYPQHAMCHTESYNGRGHWVCSSRSSGRRARPDRMIIRWGGSHPLVGSAECVTSHASMTTSPAALGHPLAGTRLQIRPALELPARSGSVDLRLTFAVSEDLDRGRRRPRPQVERGAEHARSRGCTTQRNMCRFEREVRRNEWARTVTRTQRGKSFASTALGDRRPGSTLTA